MQQQLDWYKLIYALVEDNINSGGPLKVCHNLNMACVSGKEQDAGAGAPTCKHLWKP